VVIRCAELGSPTINVPAPISALLASSGATRMQATFRRGKLAAAGAPNILIMSGHAIRGISN
jgi:hypothetical protein